MSDYEIDELSPIAQRVALTLMHDVLWSDEHGGLRAADIKRIANTVEDILRHQIGPAQEPERVNEARGDEHERFRRTIRDEHERFNLRVAVAALDDKLTFEIARINVRIDELARPLGDNIVRLDRRIDGLADEFHTHTGGRQ